MKLLQEKQQYKLFTGNVFGGVFSSELITKNLSPEREQAKAKSRAATTSSYDGLGGKCEQQNIPGRSPITKYTPIVDPERARKWNCIPLRVDEITTLHGIVRRLYGKENNKIWRKAKDNNYANYIEWWDTPTFKICREKMYTAIQTWALSRYANKMVDDHVAKIKGIESHEYGDKDKRLDDHETWITIDKAIKNQFDTAMYEHLRKQNDTLIESLRRLQQVQQEYIK